MAFTKKTEVEAPPEDVRQASEELLKLGPLARRFLKVLATHGGALDHLEIVRNLGDVSAEALREAVLQCKASRLLYDKWPSATDPRHTWTISPFFLKVLQDQITAL